MDPVSITLGVLPLVGGAIKTSKILHKKLKIFRHYSREVRRIQKYLDRQAHFFINEMHLLLRHVIPHESHIEEMLKNGRDKRWDDKAFETSLQAALGDGYNACSEIIDDIGSAMKDLQGELQCFDELVYDSPGNESLKDTVRRLRNKVKISWNQGKLEELVKDLRASNDDLRRLREQMFELSKSDHIAGAAVQLPRRRLGQEYNQIALIKTASKALHAVLESAWSRTARPDRVLQHTVRLFLETETKEDTATQVLISCLSGHSLAREERRARLSIISQLRDWTESELLTPPSQCPTDDHRQKRRKVRFAEQETSPLFNQKLNRYDVSIRTTSTDPQNLSSTDLCSVLCKPATPRSLSKAKAHSTFPGPCLGYLDSPEASDETLRHSFYAMTPLDEAGKLRPASMADILSSHPAETSLSIVDQLKLARSLVLAVLRYHSTPWLNQHFTLSDILLFPELSSWVQSLHFVLDFTRPTTLACPSMSPQSTPRDHTLMDGIELTHPPHMHTHAMTSTPNEDAVQNAQLTHGIRNLTLWSLGTALLQIGQWSPRSPSSGYSSSTQTRRLKRPRRVEIDDVLSIRKQVTSTEIPPLGPKYKELIKRCLDCDFGYGDDLSKPRLQQAVYEGVVCQLGDMISCLEI